ncbi:hypothetical protein C8F04DRAFT_1318775 [Mycena alexandri]|uniref:Uncharacterized protein n=1 Tax=Mycena alexandri TaxID=1745969 RepID=A0AAD6T6D6_9AGAR|nr:hypothetical protein C8F04DRAFT_1318775 [Mycena alexandri]
MDSASSSSHSRWGSSGSLSGESSNSTRSNSSHKNQYKLRLPSNSFDNSYSSHYDSEAYGALSRRSGSPVNTSPILQSQDRGAYMYDQQLRSNFNALLSSLSKPTTAQSSSLPPLVTLDEANFPRAKHWQKKSWTKQIQHDAGRTSQDNRATKNCLLFITNQEGELPTKDALEDIRKLSYSVFFDCERDGILPATWSQAGLNVITRFRSTLEAAFPDLRLCYGHWKADRLASKVFMAWCGTRRKKIKDENHSDDDLEGDDGNSDVVEADSGEAVVQTQKRTASVRSHSAEPHPKRTKPNSVSSASSRGCSLEKTQDNGKRKTKNPLFNKTPATITTTPTSASTSAAAPTPASALVPPALTAPSPSSSTTTAFAAPSPSMSTVNPLGMPSLTTSTANLQAAPSPSTSTMPTPPADPINTVAPPQPTQQPAAAPTSAQTSTTVNSEPAPTPKVWKPAANSSTSKGQAAFAYKTDHPGADKDEFEKYYKDLSTTAKEGFKNKANIAKGAKDTGKAARATAKAAKSQAAQGK